MTGSGVIRRLACRRSAHAPREHHASVNETSSQAGAAIQKQGGASLSARSIGDYGNNLSPQALVLFENAATGNDPVL
jgi:hypothetical protein